MLVRQIWRIPRERSELRNSKCPDADLYFLKAQQLSEPNNFIH